MICAICQKDANDNPVAYYCVFKTERPLHDIFKCWTCLSPDEKLERDYSMRDPRRFKMDKTIKETHE